MSERIDNEELALITALVEAAKQDIYPALHCAQPELEYLRDKLRNGTPNAAAVLTARSLAELIAADPDFSAEACAAVASDVLRFTKEQLLHYVRVKATRPLTEEERRFGHEILGGAGRLLRQLLGLEKRETAEASAENALMDVLLSAARLEKYPALQLARSRVQAACDAMHNDSPISLPSVAPTLTDLMATAPDFSAEAAIAVVDNMLDLVKKHLLPSQRAQ